MYSVKDPDRTGAERRDPDLRDPKRRDPEESKPQGHGGETLRS